jgi:hypothetical protein
MTTGKYYWVIFGAIAIFIMVACALMVSNKMAGNLASPNATQVHHPGDWGNFPVRRAEYSVAFYGKVVDQNNAPVPDMIVCLNVDNQDFRLTTDKDGRIALENSYV